MNKWEIINNHLIVGDPYIKKTATTSYSRWLVQCLNCKHIRDVALIQMWKCRFCKTILKKTVLFEDYVEYEIKWWKIKIDTEDLEKVNKYSWYLTKRKSVEARIWDKLIKLHRFLKNATEWMVIDHKNWDILDNRKINLRECTQKQNCANSKKRNWTTSKYKWVHWSNSKNSWVAVIWIDAKRWKNKSKMVKSEIEWAIWYDTMAKEYWWEFARTNEKLWLL